MMHDYQDHVRIYREAIWRAVLIEWDPIGIRDIPEAQDEYDSYIEPIYKVLIAGGSKHEIFNYLWWLETEHMGLVGDRQVTEQFAERLSKLPVHIERALT